MPCVVLNGRLQGKSQVVQDELVRLGEQMVNSSEGTRALALELCREFEDRFLQHITTGEVRIFGGDKNLICAFVYNLTQFIVIEENCWSKCI